MAAVDHSKRLLIASRLVHQISREHKISIELQRLVYDEAYALEVIKFVRGENNAQTSALADAFIQKSIENGTWETAQEQPTSSYSLSPEGTVSAAAAWDPNYVPPPSSGVEHKAAVVHEATLTPRVSTVAPAQQAQSGTSSFFKRFVSSPPSQLPSTVGGSVFRQTQPPKSRPPGEPADPKNAKYIRGPR